MAVIERVTTTCDYHEEGVHPEDHKIETVEFGIDGNTYEIDLCAEEAEKLRDGLLRMANAGRRKATRKLDLPTIGKPAPRGEAARKAKARKEENDTIRGWARGNGFSVSERGQISAATRAAFAKANAAPPAQPQPEPPAEHAAAPEHTHSDHGHDHGGHDRMPAFSG